jgi:O-antigen/teichoic acid export membrane protein
MLAALSRKLAVGRFSGKAKNLGFGAFSRITALGSQFVFLILLGKFLEKSTFGDFMIVFALVRVLSSGLGTGLATLIVYHISRSASVEREISLHRSILLLGLVISGLLSTGMAVFAQNIALLFGKPSLAPWLVEMAPFLLFSTLLTISIGALDGRGKITHSITALEFFPNILRLICVPLLIPLGLITEGLAPVMAVSVMLPWLYIAFPLLKKTNAGFAKLTAWDLQYSGKLTLHSFAAMQMQGIDMLVVGWLFPSSVAADYAIASRVAALIPFFQQIIVKTFMTKAGKAIHDQNLEGLQTEIDRSRLLSVILVTLTAIAAMICYPILTFFMNKFGGSIPILALLAAGAIYRSYFPGADALIRISGHANFSLSVMLASVATLIIIPLIAGGVIGVYSVALAMLLSGLILNPVMSHFIRNKIGVRVSDSSMLFPILLGLAGTGVATLSAGHMLIWAIGCSITLASLLALAPRFNQKIFKRSGVS